MSFQLKIQVDTSQVAPATQGVVKNLEQTSDAAARANDALNKVGTTGAAAGKQAAEGIDAAAWSARAAEGDFSKLAEMHGRQEAMLRRIKGPWEVYKADLQAATDLVQAEKITTGEYEAELGRLQQRLVSIERYSMAPQLKREADILQRIQGPMREYEATLRALDALLAKELITLTDYNRELERAEKLASGGRPSYGPKPQAGGAGGGGGGRDNDGPGVGSALQAVAPAFGGLGQAFAGITAGGLAAAGAIALVGREVIGLMDDYTALTAQVVRFTSAGQSTNEILRQQYELSNALHASLEATTEVYVRVRESTNELNLGQAKQLELTHDIGVAVVASGKSAEAAAALTQRLSLAFATGAINADDMKSILREFPEIGEGFSRAMGRSRNELIAMASKGEISAQQIINAFRKMQPEMEARVKAMPETFGQQWQHAKDAVVLAIGKMAEASVDPILQLQAQAARAYLAHAQAMKELNAEYERNARLAPIIAAAQSRGLNIGAFDREAADKIAEMRIAAREAGVEIADAFDEAKNKATLFGTEVEKIKTANASRQIAEDAKRIYDALFGADDILKAQFKHWTELSDRIEVARKAVERWKALTPTGVPVSQEQRELERQIRDAETEQNTARYGKGLVEYRINLDTARDSLQDWTRAAREGAVSAEALRKKTDEVLTTLNDGRLPSAIKLWENLVLPIRDVSDDIRGLTTLFEQGRLSVFEYNVELRKLTDSMQQLRRTQLDELGVPPKLLEQLKNATNTKAFGGEATATLDIDNELEAYRRQRARDAEWAALASDPRDRLPSVADRADVQGAIDVSRTYETSDAIRKLNEELERQRQLATQFEAPAVKYEQALEDIAGAVARWGLSEQEASVLRRRARSEYDNATDSLMQSKGPMGEYEAALRRLANQYANAEISAKQYADGVKSAKITMLEASGQASTFAGGMEVAWTKMQQDAENFGATLAQLAVDDFGKLNDAIVTAANGGEVAWGQMVDQMIQDLEKLIIKQLEVAAINAIIAAVSGSPPPPGVANAIANQVPIGDSGGSTAPDAISSASAAPPPAAYRTQSAAPPGAYPYPATTARRADPAPSASAAPAVIHIHNNYDSSLGIAAIDSPAGQQRVLNTLRANRGAVRTYTGR